MVPDALMGVLAQAAPAANDAPGWGTWGPLIAVMGPIVGGVGAILGILWTKITTLEKSKEDLYVRHNECEQRATRLESQMAMLYSELERAAKETDAIVVLDKDGVIREWSPGATLLMHWPQREALGKPIFNMLYSDTEPLFRRKLEKVLAGQSPKHGPHKGTIKTKDDDLVDVAVMFSSWTGEDDKVMLGVVMKMVAPGKHQA